MHLAVQGDVVSGSVKPVDEGRPALKSKPSNGPSTYVFEACILPPICIACQSLIGPYTTSDDRLLVNVRGFLRLSELDAGVVAEDSDAVGLQPHAICQEQLFKPHAIADCWCV